MNIELKKPYISVHYPQWNSYGGNQKLHPKPEFQKDACGVVAGLDWLLYYQGKTVLSADVYTAFLDDLNRIYLPFRNQHGMSGFVFARGMNQYFRTHHMQERAHWGVPRKQLFFRIEQMLRQDLPVVLTVGPKAPWKTGPKRAITLFQKNESGSFLPTAKTSGHYMTVTGMDDTWLQVSSWGERYFIKKQEYLDYASNDSFYFFTNIFWIH